MWLNLVHAVRRLRRRPVLAALGILSLAVGIGCALACASVVNSVLVRAFPYAEPDRLVLVWENNAKRGVGLTPTSILNYRDLTAAATTFEGLGAFTDLPFSIDGPDGSERATGYRATAGLLDGMHVSPLLGRLFTQGEDTPGATDVVVLSHGLWQRRFGADPAIVGQSIRLSGVPHTVIGVMPRGFVLPPVFSARLVGADHVIKEADFWVPMKLDGDPQRRDARFLFVLGRLGPGRTLEQSQAEVSSIAARLAADYPVDDLGMDFTVVPLEQQVLSSVRTLLVLLLLAGALVLAIAVTNAAHLLLADSLTMTGETAVRSALGASAWRLASGQGTVSLVWSVLGTVGALGIAAAVQAPVAAYTKANVPRLSEVSVDGTVGALALGLGVMLAWVITLLPMVYARRLGSARSVTSTAVPVGIPRWRRLFVILQLAMAIVVLSTAGLLFRSADSLARVNPGLVAEGVSVFDLMLPESRYGSPARRIDFERRLLDEVAGVQGTQAAAVVDHLPFDGDSMVVNFTIEHQVVTDATAKPRAALRAVSNAYFDVLSIPVLEGRPFVSTDEAPDMNVAIVNQAFVRRYVPGDAILGRRLKRGTVNSAAPWMTVVGVVGSVRGAGLGADPEPEVFFPYVKDGAWATVSLIVKGQWPTNTLAPIIVERIHRADPALSPATITDMTELVARAVGQPYFYARLFGVLAAVAFVLSLAGVYSVAALGISARSNEIAIRSCVGAQPFDIVSLILRETGIAAAAAVVLGSLGAMVLQQQMASFVYGVESTDWAVIAASALTLSALALATVYIAIRRVLELRPMDLLKHGAGALA